MSSIKKWLVVARLPSVILAATSNMLGTLLAIWEGKWSIWVALLATVTGILLQILANLANDYGDWMHGANVGGRVGGQQYNGLVTLKQLKKAIWLIGVIACIVGLVLLQVANLKWVQFLAFVCLGAVASFASIAYTMGNKPYGYRGLGDLAVLLFFGFVGVLGTAYLHTETWNIAYMLPALSVGCLAVAVLNINNIRDQELDTIVGKKTLVVRIGRKAAVYYQRVVLILSIVFLIVFTGIYYQHPWQGVFLLIIPRLIKNGWLTQQLTPVHLDDKLQQLVINQFLMLLLFGLGLICSKY